MFRFKIEMIADLKRSLCGRDFGILDFQVMFTVEEVAVGVHLVLLFKA
jgi:hypothetical protein